MTPERKTGIIENSLDIATKASVAAALISLILLKYEWTAKFAVLGFLAWFSKKQFAQKSS